MGHEQRLEYGLILLIRVHSMAPHVCFLKSWISSFIVLSTRSRRMERRTSLSCWSFFSSEICRDSASEYIFLRTSFSRSRCSFSWGSSTGLVMLGIKTTKFGLYTVALIAATSLVWAVEIGDLVVVQQLCFQVLKEIRPSGFILRAVSPFSPGILPLWNPLLVSFFVG